MPSSNPFDGLYGQPKKKSNPFDGLFADGENPFDGLADGGREDFGIGAQLKSQGALHQDDVKDIPKVPDWQLAAKFFKANTAEVGSSLIDYAVYNTPNEGFEEGGEPPNPLREPAQNLRADAEATREDSLAANPTMARLYATSVMDVAADAGELALEKIREVEGTIKARVLF